MSVRIKDNLNPSLNRIVDSLQTKVTKQAYIKFKASTPKRSGNARRKTTLRGNKIHAGYNYATQLDAGSSPKAPDGMSKPTADLLNRYLNKLIRK